MKRFFCYRIKILFVFLVICVLIGIIFWQKYPFGVKRYKTISFGMAAAEKAGDSTGWAPPYDRVSKESDFFVYSLGDETMCIGSDCGIGGYFVECLGGWISGYHIAGDTPDYGLNDEDINSGKEKIITIADKAGKIVGIYPGARIRNLPYILRNHRNLVKENVFRVCSDLLPQRWKM